MKSPQTAAEVQLVRRQGRLVTRFGLYVVGFAVILALTSFLIFAGFTPILPTDPVVIGLFLANALVILILLALVAVEAWSLIVAWRAKVAGARLHARIVGLFSVIAALPAVLMAIIGSITLERSLNPAFMQDVRGFIGNTAEAARLFRESQCQSLLQEARLTAADLDRGKPLFEADRLIFRDYFSSRAKFLGFTAAAMMKPDGTIVEKVDTNATEGAEIVTPEAGDFEDARKNEPLCLVLKEGRTFIALRSLPSYPDTFLYAARPVDPFSIEFARDANNLVALYSAFDSHRRNIQIAFATMYVAIAAIMLLSAVWLGLSFANRLVAPIRRLIAATDQVSSGNLYVQVPVHRSEGDLGHLGETFNKMTSELRLQQNRLLAANQTMDARRQFTEAVLSGVPAAIIGVGPSGAITVLNPAAEKLVATEAGAGGHMIGEPIDEVLPEAAAALESAKANPMRLVQSQISLTRGGRERMFNVAVTQGEAQEGSQSYVLTLDDITDLVGAQRMAAWADVARRIAHEIKNPLTPIQLSAERLKRKYGKVIVEDRQVFDQCTDTIVRQVDDIKRMVDEFSSFARMPKARPERDDLSECVRQVLFLMRVGHPDLVFEDDLPAEPLFAKFDRRLLSQALTNVVKNATEGIAGDENRDGKGVGRIRVSLSQTADGWCDIRVVDNGKGFPKAERARLLEPYMTTRSEGTGLGLSIVAKILEDHGGGIDLLDAPDGQGACVRLAFPRGLDAEPPSETFAPREAAQQHGS